MTEKELVAKIDEIRSEHFARMHKDLAPYLAQLKVLTDARLPRQDQFADGRYQPEAYNQPSENLGNASGDYSNWRAMTKEEVDEYYRRFPIGPREFWSEPKRGFVGNLFGVPLPF